MSGAAGPGLWYRNDVIGVQTAAKVHTADPGELVCIVIEVQM